MLPEKAPASISRVVVILVLVSFIPLAFISVTRVVPSKVPRISIVPDMDSQQKFKAQSSNAMFADGRGMRYYPAGTVARGEAHLDEHLYNGIVNGQWATTFPMPVTKELMDRGKREYDIFCSPCHGFSGYGDGYVAKRADDLSLAGTPGMSWVPPKSLHDKDTRARQLGHLYNTISHGIRTMPAYGGQIPVEDRWAIVLYVRALQRSQSGQVSELPASEQQKLLASRADAIAAEDARLKAAQEAAAKEAAEAAAAKPAAGAAAAGTEAAPGTGTEAAPAEAAPAEGAATGDAPAEGASADGTAPAAGSEGTEAPKEGDAAAPSHQEGGK